MTNKNMELRIEVKNIYGREMIYPACEKSKLFALLAGNRTLTTDVLAIIKQLGYSLTKD